MANELVLEGGVWKMRDIVSAREEASYDLLAQAAKTLDHGVLMKDTSTGFYYKNWKDTGPGIPVPVRFFDDITGHVPNSSDTTKKAFLTLEDTLAECITRGWTDESSGSGTVTKPLTSGEGPLVLTPAASGATAAAFSWTTGFQAKETLAICKINAITGGTSGGARRCGFLPSHANADTSATEGYYFWFDLLHILGEIHITKHTTTSDATLAGESSDQPDTSGVIDQWLVMHVDTSNDNRQMSAFWVTDNQIVVSKPGAVDDYTASPIRTQPRFRAEVNGVVIKYSEFHMLYM